MLDSHAGTTTVLRSVLSLKISLFCKQAKCPWKQIYPEQQLRKCAKVSSKVVLKKLNFQYDHKYVFHKSTRELRMCWTSTMSNMLVENNIAIDQKGNNSSVGWFRECKLPKMMSIFFFFLHCDLMYVQFQIKKIKGIKIRPKRIFGRIEVCALLLGVAGRT